MPLIRRSWTAHQADEWTREDWITIVLSPICYTLLMLGVALSLLLRPAGYVMLVVGVVLTAVMHWIIDPKLKAISEEYESKQQEYLRELEEKVRWQHLDRENP